MRSTASVVCPWPLRKSAPLVEPLLCLWKMFSREVIMLEYSHYFQLMTLSWHLSFTLEMKSVKCFRPHGTHTHSITLIQCTLNLECHNPFFPYLWFLIWCVGMEHILLVELSLWRRGGTVGSEDDNKKLDDSDVPVSLVLVSLPSHSFICLWSAAGAARTQTYCHRIHTNNAPCARLF